MAKIPVVQFTIDPNKAKSGVKVLSLVDQPAIQSDFVFFSKQKSQFQKLEGEQFKQIVAGLVLIPDQQILRLDANGNPFYGIFSKETIVEARNKFHKEKLTDVVNTQHSDKDYVDAFLIESFIIDSEERLKDVKLKGIKEATIGSWFVAYKIEDAETFKKVVDGELRGFSVEIFLSGMYQPEDNNLNDLSDLKTEMKNFLQKFKELLNEAEQAEVKPAEVPAQPESKKFEDSTTTDGKTIRYTSEGESVSIVSKNEDGSEKVEVAPDGDYVLSNGSTVSVASGVASAVKKPEQPADQKAITEAPKENKELTEQFSKLKLELEAAKAEIEKLKKLPTAKPAGKNEVEQLRKTKPDMDESKLSNADKFRLKHGVELKSK